LLWICPKLEQIKLSGFSRMCSRDDDYFLYDLYHGSLGSDSDDDSGIFMDVGQERKEWDPAAGVPPWHSTTDKDFLASVSFATGPAMQISAKATWTTIGSG
jgi:hypothetical protein